MVMLSREAIIESREGGGGGHNPTSHQKFF